MYIGFDLDKLGVKLCEINDLDLLIKWYNLYNGTEADTMLLGLWIRINQIHPKYLLRFDDAINRRTLQDVLTNEDNHSMAQLTSCEGSFEPMLSV